MIIFKIYRKKRSNTTLNLKFVKLFGWPDSRKQKQLRSIDNTCAKNHFFPRENLSH